MRDELPRGKASRNECLVLNIDHSSNDGTHWTCLFIDNDDVSYYFDSFGLPPPLEVLEYCSNGRERFYSSFKVQEPDDVICGHYCIYTLARLSAGDDFYCILSDLQV